MKPVLLMHNERNEQKPCIHQYNKIESCRVSVLYINIRCIFLGIKKVKVLQEQGREVTYKEYNPGLSSRASAAYEPQRNLPY